MGHYETAAHALSQAQLHEWHGRGSACLVSAKMMWEGGRPHEAILQLQQQRDALEAFSPTGHVPSRRQAYDDEDVVRTVRCKTLLRLASYLGELDSMRKVVKECKGEPQLRTLADKLTSEGIAHKMWLEQPENIPTAIALKPYPRSKVQPLLKKYQLFK